MESDSLGSDGGGGGGGGGGMFSGLNSAMLGLDLPLHPHPTNPPNSHQLHHASMVSYAPQKPQLQQQPPPTAVRYPYPAKPKPQQSNLSDDEEQGFAVEDGNSDGKKKISPWQRMKWTDMMVRLLITAVFYIGDEGGTEQADHAGKKKPVGLLQKKGKWKSVSRAMMEKGFYVSPQQCEDKFNDLNKRYKRVNDILGKGTACRVVENQTLLDSMELTPKTKEEVRKLLNSKHLFFREMCAYHNTCRHSTGNNGGGGAHPSPDTAAEPPSHLQQHQHQQQQQQQRCFHATESAAAAATVGADGDDEDEDDEEEESEEDEDDEEEEIEGTSRGHEEEDETESRKRARKGGIAVAAMQQLNAEVIGVLQDGGRSPWEKKQWMKSRLIQLEEQQVNYQSQAFELEKQRLKWLKFRSKKERDMERAKLENEKRRLETERMVLMVKQKELDWMDMHHYQQQQHSSNKRGDPSSITG
ncbi:uncharacterized protein LOC111441130 [Cucurbita moschata]|uniref:Uncharacterized protein LOC111441130 n=1 Tax=Cucurbita moschata TaxID=3662 RepID=A0A6J1F055_CUCMO|nr:uncharacterized protein LOC111441130 [Cucurbita moschata]